MGVFFFFLWFYLCHQEVLVVWRVFAWEDPISVLGVFVLHPPLCSSTSKSQHGSRQDLKSVWLRKKLPHENELIFLQLCWNSFLIPFIPMKFSPCWICKGWCSFQLHFQICATADEWTGQIAENNVINGSFIHSICSRGKTSKCNKKNCKTVIVIISRVNV